MICPICSGKDFYQNSVLKPRLINEWKLSTLEVDYINKQQGFCCTNCNSSLRSITLADSILKHYNFRGRFNQFIYSKKSRRLNLLEVNEAGNLHEYLTKFKNYEFGSYPEIDMQNLPYLSNTFDLIIHSDTLEHVEDSLKALKECFRVLKPNGVLFYTIPIVYSRITKRRHSDSNSYHGTQEEHQGEDYKVWTEYGADFWVEIINAGFKNVHIHTIDDLSSLAICAIKDNNIKIKLNLMSNIYIQLNRVKCKIKKLIN